MRESVPIMFPLRLALALFVRKPLIIRVVRREGIEPSTNWLKANCSTAELPAHFRNGGGMYSQESTAQAGICSRADFLNQQVETALGTLDGKKVDSGLCGPLGIASGIIADVQTVLRLQADCGQRGLEHAGMRFGGPHLAGDHDLLEKAAQIMPGKDAA